MDEVSCFKRDGVARDGDIVIIRRSVREVTTHCKRHRFVLQTQVQSFQKESLLEVKIILY